jgi:cyclophilin family peptidyl-prolyl cis-trans isomerase
MKKVLILSLGVFFLAGCSATSTNLYGQETVKTPIVPVTEEKAVVPQQPVSKMETASKTNQEKSMFEKAQEANLSAKYSKAILTTNFGDIEVEFFADKSPQTVNNFMYLAQEKFYDQTQFHRVIKDFMIQGGDPNSKDDDWTNDGIGGPGYKFKDEFNKVPLVKGSLAMANSGPNTNGSQFFIVTLDATPWLDGKHTNFGKVIKGMEVVTKIENMQVNENDHPTSDAMIKSIKLVK